MADLDGLLHALEERASTARTIFMLLDSDADGLVAVEQVSPCSAHAPSRVAAAVFPGGAWPACGSLRADARPRACQLASIKSTCCGTMSPPNPSANLWALACGAADPKLPDALTFLLALLPAARSWVPC
jgi:hypothetical protein